MVQFCTKMSFLFGTFANRQNVPFMVQYNHSQGRELAQSEIKVGEFKSSWSRERTNKNLKTLTNLKRKGDKNNEQE